MSVKAEYPKSEANSTENGGNESTVRLSEIVEQNYWCLRSTMTEHEMQTLYLLDNIRMECLRSPLIKPMRGNDKLIVRMN